MVKSLNAMFSMPWMRGSSARDGRLPGGIDEALRGQRGADAAHRLSHVVGGAHVSQMQLVYRSWAEGGGEGDNGKLGAAHRQGIEAGNIGAALRRGVRVVEAVIVGEIVAGKRAPARGAVNADGALVVAERLVVGRGGKNIGGMIWCGDTAREYTAAVPWRARTRRAAGSARREIRTGRP